MRKENKLNYNYWYIAQKGLLIYQLFAKLHSSTDLTVTYTYFHCRITNKAVIRVNG